MSSDSKIKFDMEAIKRISFFEKVTGAKVKDSFIDKKELLYFVVEPKQYGLAVGKNGSNIKRVETSLKRRIKVVEFSDDLTQLIASLIRPVKPKNIEMEEEIATITINPEDSKNRGYLIGRGGQNLRSYEEIIRRYFSLKELKVV
jgi:transcription termination/antitermination protein NusA